MRRELICIDGDEIRSLAPGFDLVLRAVGTKFPRELYFQTKRWLITKVEKPERADYLIIVLLACTEGSVSEKIKLDDISHVRFYHDDILVVTEKRGDIFLDTSFNMKYIL